MTDLLHQTDSYLRRFDATVTEVAGDAVVLDRSAFYATSGGQPHDVGSLAWDGGEAKVVEVVRRDGKHLHRLAGGLPPVGARVRGEIDWPRRYALMRTHTALHVLAAVIFRDYGAQVTGSNMKPLEARMDFEKVNLLPEGIEQVRVIGHENKGKINKRLRIALDP